MKKFRKTGLQRKKVKRVTYRIVRGKWVAFVGFSTYVKKQPTVVCVKALQHLDSTVETNSDEIEVMRKLVVKGNRKRCQTRREVRRITIQKKTVHLTSHPEAVCKKVKTIKYRKRIKACHRKANIRSIG